MLGAARDTADGTAPLSDTRPDAVVDSILAATNAHDLDALVGCFAENYDNATPVHPARSFRGREQVRRNWQQIFAFVPDLRAAIVRRAADGDTVWTEWEMSGTRHDGSAHLMRGVVVFVVADGLASHARFYLEPVDEGATGIDEAVRAQVARPSASGAAAEATPAVPG